MELINTRIPDTNDKMADINIAFNKIFNFLLLGIPNVSQIYAVRIYNAHNNRAINIRIYPSTILELIYFITN